MKGTGMSGLGPEKVRAQKRGPMPTRGLGADKTATISDSELVPFIFFLISFLFSYKKKQKKKKKKEKRKKKEGKN